MKRALMFLLLGPALVVVPWLIFIAAIDGLRVPVDFVATVLFIFTFLVAAIAGLVDGCLARSFADTFANACDSDRRSDDCRGSWPTLFSRDFFAVNRPAVDAVRHWRRDLTGACSLLAHDYRQARAFHRAESDSSGRQSTGWSRASRSHAHFAVIPIHLDGGACSIHPGF